MTIVLPVLLYHSVSDHPPVHGSWGAVTCAAFASHIDAIEASGRKAVTVTKLAAMLRGEHRLPDRAVAVTFDDGYADTYRAAGALAARGIPSSVYVTTGRIGTPGWLSEEQVADLARLPGVEVGAHGVRHQRLDELPHAEVTRELADSRAHLEELIGRRVDSFAYPHGAHDRRVRAGVIAHGYRSAAAVKNALSHTGDDPFAIARFTVTASTPADLVAELLQGRGAPLAWRGERLRTRAYRVARRQRRRLLRPRGTPS
jgi:peptidoglycan/xylan/chitin deacetylase (PgdA/CDA1 family)